MPRPEKRFPLKERPVGGFRTKKIGDRRRLKEEIWPPSLRARAGPTRPYDHRTRAAGRQGAGREGHHRKNGLAHAASGLLQ